MSIAAVVFVVYLGLTIMMTVVSMLKTNQHKSTDSYILANRSMIWPLVAFGSFGAAVGGTATVGAIANVYIIGISACIYGMCRGANSFAFAACAEKIRGLKTPNPGIICAKVFQPIDEIYYMFAMGVTLVGLIGVQVMAAAAVLPAVFPISFQTACLICAVLFGGITLVGGFLSVGLTNVVNAVFILLGIVICAIAGVSMCGGWGGLMEAIPKDPPKWVDWTQGLPIAIIIAYIISLIPKMADSADYLGIQSAATTKDARIGYVCSGVLQFVLAGLVGIVGLVAVVQVPGMAGQGVYGALATKISPIVGALSVAGIYAAATSCAQAWILSAGTIFLNIWKKTTKKAYDNKTELFLIKVIVVIVSVLSYFVATKASSIVSFAIGISSITAPLGMVFIAMYYKPSMLRKSSFSLAFWLAFVVFVIGMIPNPLQADFNKAVVHIAYPMAIVGLIALFVPPLYDKNRIDTTSIYSEAYLEKFSKQ